MFLALDYIGEVRTYCSETNTLVNEHLALTEESINELEVNLKKLTEQGLPEIDKNIKDTLGYLDKLQAELTKIKASSSHSLLDNNGEKVTDNEGSTMADKNYSPEFIEKLKQYINDFDKLEHRVELLEINDRDTVLIVDGVKLEENKTLKESLLTQLNANLDINLQPREIMQCNYIGKEANAVTN